ncbi:MAG: hypothetical protein ACK4PI_07380 [Tepidisphaerales bacterium]
MSLPTGPIRAFPRKKERDCSDRVLPLLWEFIEGDIGRLRLTAPWIDAADATATTAFAWALPAAGGGVTARTQQGVGQGSSTVRPAPAGKMWPPPKPRLVERPTIHERTIVTGSPAGRSQGLAEDVAEPLLFLLPQSVPDALLKTFLASLVDQRRVYVLADLGFGAGNRDPGLRDRSGAWILVRRTSLPLLPAVIGCTSRQVTLLVGSLGDPSRYWAVELDEAQRLGFTRVALHLFWHHATDEAWTDPAAGTLTFREPEQRPGDFIPPADGAVQWLRRPVDPVMPPDGAVWIRGDLVHVSSSCSPRRLITRPSGDPAHFETISRLAEKGTEVVCIAEPFPDLWVTAETGVIEWTLGSYVLRLRLTTPQARPLFASLGSVQPAAILRRNLGLREVSGKVLIPGATSPESCIQRVEVAADDVLCTTLDDVVTAEPSGWPEPPPLARQVVFSWKNLPPLAPAKAARSPLYQQWDELRSTVQSRVEMCRKTLDRVAQQSDEAKLKLGKFFAGVLGLDRRRQELSAELEKLASTRPDGVSVEPAKTLLEMLARVEAGVNEYRLGVEGDVTVAEREAQRARWEEEKSENQKRLDATQVELAAARLKKNALDQELAAGQKSDEQERDWQARQKKLKDDLKVVEADVKRLEARCKDLQHQIDRPLQYKSSGQQIGGQGTGKGFVPEPPAASNSIRLPSETLPTVGELLEENKQRFLVIERWDQLESGRHEAQRLKARLVARQR